MNVPIEDDRAGFLRAIRTNPAADLPRLVFADWLDEQGNQSDSDRSEFIRLQCRSPESVYPHPFNPSLRELSGFSGEYDGMGLAIWEPTFLSSRGPCCLVRRGFVAEVADTMEGHIGGECEACGGTRLHQSAAMDDCPACHGTGRTPGRLRDLRTRHPIEAVRVTDREPMRVADFLGGGWCWHRWAPGRFDENELPTDVWERLAYGNIDPAGWSKNYPTESAAVESLSRALLSLTNPEPT